MSDASPKLVLATSGAFLGTSDSSIFSTHAEDSVLDVCIRGVFTSIDSLREFLMVSIDCGLYYCF